MKRSKSRKNEVRALNCSLFENEECDGDCEGMWKAEDGGGVPASESVSARECAMGLVGVVGLVGELSERDRRWKKDCLGGGARNAIEKSQELEGEDGVTTIAGSGDFSLMFASEISDWNDGRSKTAADMVEGCVQRHTERRGDKNVVARVLGKTVAASYDTIHISVNLSLIYNTKILLT